MRSIFTRVAALAGAATIAVLVAAPAVSAHEEAEVGGGYHAVIGWGDEPAYVGFKNSVQVILMGPDEKPVTDLDTSTLKVEVSSGGQKTTVPLEANFEVGEFGEEGDYRGWLIPTRSGEYTFRVVGDVKGTPIDKSVTCGDSTFDCPHEPSEVMFPTKDPSAGQLATNIQRLNPRVDSAVTAANASKSTADDADDKASTAQIIGVIGIVLAIALGGAALAVAAKANKKAKPAS